MTSRLPWRRASVPTDLRKRVPLRSGQKILGWSWLPGEGWAVATGDELMVMATDAGTDAEPLRLPWHLVTTGVWADGALDVIAAQKPGGPQEQYRFEIDEVGLLPEAVHTLVTGSILWSGRMDDKPLAAAVFTARRDPSGHPTWSVVFDRGFDASDPELRAWADERIARLREQTGL